jgi:hypothetical protein
VRLRLHCHCLAAAQAQFRVCHQRIKSLAGPAWGEGGERRAGSCRASRRSATTSKHSMLGGRQRQGKVG